MVLYILMEYRCRCLKMIYEAEIVHSIEGLEDAILLRPGYSVEYDFVDPKNLDTHCKQSKS